MTYSINNKNQLNAINKKLYQSAKHRLSNSGKNDQTKPTKIPQLLKSIISNM